LRLRRASAVPVSFVNEIRAVLRPQTGAEGRRFWSSEVLLFKPRRLRMRPGEQLLIARRRVRRLRGLPASTIRYSSLPLIGSLQFLSKNPRFGNASVMLLQSSIWYLLASDF
jgi:hypothetical protein